MDTNQCSSGFPARVLSCCGYAFGELCRLFGSREDAKSQRETQKVGVRCTVFGVRWASRGRESAGAGVRGCGSPRVRESAGAGPGEWSHAKPRRGSKERFGDTFSRLSVCPFRSHEFEFFCMNAVPPDPLTPTVGDGSCPLFIST